MRVAVLLQQYVPGSTLCVGRRPTGLKWVAEPEIAEACGNRKHFRPRKVPDSRVTCRIDCEDSYSHAGVSVVLVLSRKH